MKISSQSDIFTNFKSIILSYNKKWDDLRNAMKDYYELGKYIFVHGWIPINTIFGSSMKITYKPNWREAHAKEWDEARWLNGMEMADMGIVEPNKIIVCGHWHTSYGHSLSKRKTEEFYDPEDSEFGPNADFSIYKSSGIIALDACTAFSGYCNCLHLKEEDL